jgi:hypothetical protein
MGAGALVGQAVEPVPALAAVLAAGLDEAAGTADGDLPAKYQNVAATTSAIPARTIRLRRAASPRWAPALVRVADPFDRPDERRLSPVSARFCAAARFCALRAAASVG